MEKETYVEYIVQSWTESEYGDCWTNTSEPAKTMFGFPVSSYVTEEEGLERLTKLQAQYPAANLRLVRQTTITEVV